MSDTHPTLVKVCAEQTGDEKAIYDLTKRAFAPMPFSDGDEQDLVNRLRDHNALAISLVAKRADQIVGHIAFSPAFPDDGKAGWYALGPVSVEPSLQKSGVGSQLIHHGLDMLRERSNAGCILAGNPNYYKRFGFVVVPECCPDGEPSEYYQMIWFHGERPQQIISFHKLFHTETS